MEPAEGSRHRGQQLARGDGLIDGMDGSAARRAARCLAAACLSALALLVGAAGAGAAGATLGAGVYATAIVSAGQNVWFGGSNYVGAYDVVGRIGPAGELAEYRLPPGRTPTRELTGIAVGPFGNLWLSSNEERLLRVTPTGTTAEFPASVGSNRGIILGPDGTLRFTSRTGALGRTKGNGETTTVSLPPGSEPAGLAAGPEGAIWVAESGAGAIARVEGNGNVTQYPLPHSDSRPAAIAVGPDGNLWFSEEGAPRIGRITPGGTITEFSVPGLGGTRLIANGPAGDLWYTQDNWIGSITTQGAAGQPACIDSECRTTIDALAAGPGGELLVATGVRETAAGEGLSLTELGVGGSIEGFTPPPLTTGLRGVSKLRGRRTVAVRLTCRGGVAGDTCGGSVRLRAHGRLAGNGGYRLAPMTGEALPIALTNWAARALRRRGKLRVQVVVDNVVGEGTSRSVVLRARP
jgi:streptogramin lyase